MQDVFSEVASLVDVSQAGADTGVPPHSQQNRGTIFDSPLQQGNDPTSLQAPASRPEDICDLHPDALATRFEALGRHEVLEGVVSLDRQALELGPEQTSHLYNRKGGSSTEYQPSGQYEDLDVAISFYRDALDLPHPERSAFLYSLAYAFRTRFERSGQHEDLERAISFYQESVELRVAPHPHRSDSLHALAYTL
jgi:hypothetical protein